MTQKLKIAIVLICLSISIYCFMIKLPVPLRKMDTELHALFFFSASAFLNIVFLVRKLNNHLMIFGMLFLFSVLIEFSQEYSNSIFKRRIHGNFDPNDLKYNLLGLCCFSLLWLTYHAVLQLRKQTKTF